MAIRMSTGLKAALYGNYGIKAMLQLGRISVYTGDQPLSPDAPPTGDYLGGIYDFSTNDPEPVPDYGLRVQINEFGQLEKRGTWTFLASGTGNGQAGWWRWSQFRGDGNGISLTAPRIDGLVGESLVLSDTSIVPLQEFDINIFSMQFLED